MKYTLNAIFAAAVLVALAVPAQGGFDLEDERTKLWEWIARKHADLGDEYARAELYVEARRQYNRSRELDPDNRNAMKGLGYRQRRGEWVVDELLPEENGVSGSEYLEAMEKLKDARADTYDKCAHRARRLMEKALRDDERAARIIAIDLLYYAPDDAEARSLRGHVQSGDSWAPGFADEWRKAGSRLLVESSFGEEKEVEDEQGRKIGAEFDRRESMHLIARTTISKDRTKMLHRACEACMKLTLELLDADLPFGGHKFTVTHLNGDEYEAMLTEVLELEGEKLKFAKRLSGHGTGEVYGYMNRASTGEAADDMLGNTVSLRVLAHNQAGSSRRGAWISTGFGYLVTSRVLGTTKTQRYTLKEEGTTASSREIQPEFGKESGTPGLLREVALYNINFDRDVPLSRLIVTEINDMTQAHAAKAFAFMEWAFSEHPEKAKTLLTAGGVETGERMKQIEDAFDMKLDEVEAALKEWVLAKY